MSGTSANGHRNSYVNFEHMNSKLSSSVDNSRLNKTDKFSNSSGSLMNHSFDKAPGENSRGVIPNPCMFSSSQSTKNSENDDEKKLSRNKDELSEKKIKVLIAEDDEVSSQLLTIVLKEISKEIIRTQTGKETLKQCKNHKDIDLILMDIKMPELDGFETTKQIREFNKDVYIIAQTARALEGDREEAFFAGCNDYITKPIDRITLLDKIKKIL